MEDKNLAAYYDRLKRVVSGDLWDWERLKAIWLFNMQQYNKPIRERQAFARLQHRAAELSIQERWAEAGQALEEARDLFPNHLDNLFWMACTYQKAEKPDQVLEALDRALELDSAFAPALFNRLLIRVEKGQGERALQEFSQVIRLHPDTLSILDRLILKLIALGHIDTAKRFYAEALRVNPAFKLEGSM